ncbi:hypothetical protein ODS41_06240 [Pyrobaculum sp. 3827-6]|nr:hypothetical protein [Pyrobaculum sp. 3827-6]
MASTHAKDRAPTREGVYESNKYPTSTNNSTAILHRLYELRKRQINGVDCLRESTKCANLLKKILGSELWYVRENPLVYVARNDLASNPYLSPYRIEDINLALGLNLSSIEFEFGSGVVDKSPYEIRRLPPYKGPTGRVPLRIYYQSRYKQIGLWLVRDWNLFDVELHLLRGEDELSTVSGSIVGDPGVSVLIVGKDFLEKHFDDIVRLKRESFEQGNGRSRLQIINGDDLGGKIRARGAKYILANLRSAILYKAHYTPFRVVLPKGCELCDLISSSLVVGMALAKEGNDYIKAVAVLMTSSGDVVGYVDTKRVFRGRSMELRADEAEEFGGKVGKLVNEYRSHYVTEFRREPGLIIIARSRSFREEEATRVRRGFSTILERVNSGIRNVLSEDNLLFMSTTKTDYNFGRDVAAHVASINQRNAGAWFLQPASFERAVKVSYQGYMKDFDVRLPAIAYTYLRALDFTSLSGKRTTIAPVTYAKRFLRWYKH